MFKNTLENINFITIYSDASNHTDIMFFLSLIRYFDIQHGIQTKVLDLVSLPGETSEMIANSIVNILKDNNLTQDHWILYRQCKFKLWGFKMQRS